MGRRDVKCRYEYACTSYNLTPPHTLVFGWTRFQLKLVYGCGHSVQEDQPAETAASIINFAIRCVGYNYILIFEGNHQVCRLQYLDLRGNINASVCVAVLFRLKRNMLIDKLAVKFAWAREAMQHATYEKYLRRMFTRSSRGTTVYTFCTRCRSHHVTHTTNYSEYMSSIISYIVENIEGAMPAWRRSSK